MSANEREKNRKCLAEHRAHWVVLQRQCNYSAFSGYRYTPSAYSAIRCNSCDRVWRTRAGYVAELPDVGETSRPLTGVRGGAPPEQHGGSRPSEWPLR
jgi:hypothetical protein